MLAVSKVIAEEVRRLVLGVMESDVGVNQKAGKNTLVGSRLYDSVVTMAAPVDDVVVSLLLNHYIVFVESGRRAGAKMPPFNAIAEWCKRKGIPADNSTVWAICKAISRDGIQPRPVIATLFDIIDSQYADAWMDMIFDEITKELDKLFV